MKRLIFSLIGIIVIVPFFLSAQDIKTRKVAFAQGTSSTIIKDTLTGYQTIDYVLNAREGQTISVKLNTTNGANYFNLLAPGENEVAFYNSSIDGNEYKGKLTKSGDQKIRVYLMRSAARRGEAAAFTLEVAIID